jgi:hypothetical protein
LRPERVNHVWSYDFVKAMTHDGRAVRILVVIDDCPLRHGSASLAELGLSKFDIRAEELLVHRLNVDRTDLLYQVEC